jgi:hypothetical protein
MPQTRLKIAFPLVSGGRPNATEGSTGGTGAADAPLPQTAQKVSASDKLFPQAGQNELNEILFS